MPARKQASNTKSDPVAAGVEHEKLLLEAARLLPEIIAREFQDLDAVYKQTCIEAKEWLARLEKAIAAGRIESAKHQAWLRDGFRDVPRYKPLDPATVTFGHSLHEHRKVSWERADIHKRLGMADLKLNWVVPAGKSLSVACYDDFSGLKAISSPGDVYKKLTVKKARALAKVFDASVPLGRVLEQMEDLADKVRIDATTRIPQIVQAPLIAITPRREVFDAVTTKYDALLIEVDSYEWDVESVRASLPR